MKTAESKEEREAPTKLEDSGRMLQRGRSEIRMHTTVLYHLTFEWRDIFPGNSLNTGLVDYLSSRDETLVGAYTGRSPRMLLDFKDFIGPKLCFPRSPFATFLSL
jgi:hypothetical protein